MKMDKTIGIYVNYTKRPKLGIVNEMKYAAEKIVELERVVNQGKQAEKELEKVMERMTELALELASLRGNM